MRTEIKVGSYVCSNVDAIKTGRKFIEGFVKRIEFNIASIKTYQGIERENLIHLKEDMENCPDIL